MALLGWLKNNCNYRCPYFVTFLYLPILYSYWMRQKESPQETKLKMFIQSFPINCTGLVACTQYPTSPTDPPQHIMHSHKYWTHAHLAVSLRGVIKWQTVLAMSTNGHFNALGVKGLVLRGHLIRAGVFNTSPTKRSVSKGGRVWWMMRLPHTCTQGPQYVPSPPISPTTIPKLSTRSLPPSWDTPFPIDPLCCLSIRTPHPSFIFGGSASHAELTRGTCWVWAHRISLQDRGSMPQMEPWGLPLPWITLLRVQAEFKISCFKNRF